MCYARRQRSSWARIKLSDKLYINRVSPDNIKLRAVLALLLIKRVSKNSKEFSESFRLTSMKCFVIVVQFSRSFALPAIVDSLYIIPPSLPFVNPFLKLFSKSFKKLLKNLLTKASGCDIINKSPRERRRAKIAHWKLNNNVLRKTPKILLNLQKLLNSN